MSTESKGQARVPTLRVLAASVTREKGKIIVLARFDAGQAMRFAFESSLADWVALQMRHFPRAGRPRKERPIDG